MKKYLIVFIITFVCSFDIRAETQFSIAPSLMHFDYTEFASDNSVLDCETGWLAGIQFKLAQNLSNQLGIELEISAQDGKVDYAGHTQSGLPHNTQTNEGLIRIGARLIAPILSNSHIYLATQHHQWKREIYSNNGVAGLFEKYQWWEISAGSRILLWSRDNQAWIADIAILRTLNPTLFVDISSVDAGYANLDLGSDTGARLQLMWKIAETDQYTYGINAFYEIWDFGISDVKQTQGGSTSFSVFEPRSETRHSGIQFQLKLKY